jgi:putative heme-binding domain-containing protein
LDFDEDGELIYSTNLGPYRMLHGVQGGYYWKSFGKHGALHNPYTYGYFEHVPHENFTGGHVTVGGIIYQGDALPEQFRGKYIAGDLLGHSVQWHNLERWGSSFKSSYRGELVVPHDTWFASSDVTMGPNGSVYVADWFDKRTAHPDPDADWDRSNGRVYEVAPDKLKRDSVRANLRESEIHAGAFDLRTLSSGRLVELLNSRNDWFVRKARRILADRRDPSVIRALRKQILESDDDHLALESFWALYVSGGFNDDLAMKLLAHRSPAIRRWTVRLLGDENKVSSRIAKRLTQLAGSESDVRVRAQLACTAKRISAEQALPLLQAILARNLDRNDPYVPLLLWWGVEHHAGMAMNQVVEAFATRSAWEAPLTREIILPRLMRRYAAEATQASLGACARLLESSPNETAKKKMLSALDQGLPDRLNAGNGLTTALVQPINALWRENCEDKVLIRVLARLGHESARKRALALAASKGAAPELRVAMLEVLGQLSELTSANVLLACINPAEPEAVQIAALSALQSIPQAEVQGLLADYPSLSPSVRGKAREVLLSRRPWALLFLAGIDSGRFSFQEVPLEQLQRVALLGDQRLNELVRKHWGNITPGTPEEKLADVRRFNNDLRAFAGDASQGHELFKKTCAVCHRLFGEGNQLGPDLTGANRKDRDYLLVNIVDPSSVIRKEFVSYNVETSDGQILAGLIAEQSADTVTLLAANGEHCVLPRGKIKSLEESKISLMPEGLLHGLKPQELRDLFAYLQSDPPLANSKKP